MASTLPSANTLRVWTPCFRRIINRRQVLVLDQKPEILRNLTRLDRNTWRQYENHLARAHPLDRAEAFARQMEARRLKSGHALERLLGLPCNSVRRALRLLDLPEPIRTYLKQERSPANQRFFTERRLLELVRIGDAKGLGRRFQEMLEEARHEAGLWSASPEERVSGSRRRRRRPVTRGASQE